MRLPHALFYGIAIVLLVGKLSGADAGSPNVGSGGPNGSTPNVPIAQGILAWDSITRETNVVGSAGEAHFVFSFTNISSGKLVVQRIEPSCGCTRADLPSLPWSVPARSNGQIALTVNLLGKARKRTETAVIYTDKGFAQLAVTINIVAPAVPRQPAAERSRSLALAKADRQAIFRGSCVKCHLAAVEEKQDGRALYYALCAACHEGKNRAKTTADLFAIRTPTDVAFWINWIAHGKSGTVMPGFAKEEGGPLSEAQIANLAQFLNTSDTLDEP